NSRAGHVSARRRKRRGPVLAKSVVALEGRSADVVDVDVLARGDVLAREADDLAVLSDRLPFLDSPQRELVPEADSVGEPHGGSVHLDVESRLQIASSDGDVVLGPQVNGDLRQRHGRHGCTPENDGISVSRRDGLCNCALLTASRSQIDSVCVIASSLFYISIISASPEATRSGPLTYCPASVQARSCSSA